MYNISPNIIIEVSKDGLSAYVTMINKEKLDSNDNGDIRDLEAEKKSIDEIIKEIKEILKVGLNESELKQILDNENYDKRTCIARGILPIDGKDGYIKYHFDLEKKLTPKIHTNGTVNYRELDIINGVIKGDTLAELIPPRAGRSGFKVTGETIPYKKGKFPILRYGKNVKPLDNGAILVADKDGLVMLKDNRVIVLDIFHVKNIDKSTGNISFNGAIVVDGNVLNGYKVKATGDVSIKGVVEGAYIENDGDVFVRQGILGFNRLTIKSKGNITTKFIENAILYSTGTVSSEVIMHSCIYSKENIIVTGKRGLIAGGICRAGKEIHANIIGSSMATKTTIEVGTDPDIIERNIELKNNIEMLEDNLSKVFKSIRLLEKLKKTRDLNEKQMDMYIRLLKTKNSLDDQLLHSETEYEDRQKEIAESSRGFVKVANTIYPGVRVTIGNSSMIVRDEMKRCSFFRDGGEIKVGPY